MNRTDLNFADLLAQRHAAKRDAYWRDHADTLEEPFRTQLLDALDLFQGTKSPRQRNMTEPGKPRHPSSGRIGNGA